MLLFIHKSARLLTHRTSIVSLQYPPFPQARPEVAGTPAGTLGGSPITGSPTPQSPGKFNIHFSPSAMHLPSITHVKSPFTTSPFKIPALPTSYSKTAKQREKMSNHTNWDDFVPRVPRSFEAAYSAVSTPSISPRGKPSEEAVLHLGATTGGLSTS